MLLYIRDLVFDPLTSAWTADSAYSTLMGNSAVLNTDQESESVCDELVGDELMGDLHRSEEERGKGHGNDGEEQGQACTERQPLENFDDELAPDFGGVHGSDMHSIQQRVL